MRQFRLEELLPEICPRLYIEIIRMSPDSQIWLFYSNPVLSLFLTWRQIMSLGPQIVSTWHGNPDKLKSLLEVSAEGHRGVIQVSRGHFYGEIHIYKGPSHIIPNRAFKVLGAFFTSKPKFFQIFKFFAFPLTLGWKILFWSCQAPLSLTLACYSWVSTVISGSGSIIQSYCQANLMVLT